ncbi:MAG: lipoprotein-releasing ABC transporter permease subunit [Celeribacter marinus]
MTEGQSTKPFSRFEWMIAWRYLRARREEGGVSVMTWISLIGITLAVAALIITLSVRTGFRTEFVDTILGANAHATVYSSVYVDENGQTARSIDDYDEWADKLLALPEVIRAAPLVRGQVMASRNGSNAGIEVYGIAKDDLMTIPRVAEHPDESWGDVARFEEGIAIGSGVARELGVVVGDSIKLISPDGAKTAFGISPRVSAFEVVYIFTAGRYDIDKTRAYLPFAEAQRYFNSEGAADEIEVMLAHPDTVDEISYELMQAVGDNGLVWTWKQSAGSFLSALDMEDNVMFVILSVLVLIAAMNIVSGLIMLVKNKGRDIGILRTIGLTEGSVLRVFFICGAVTGVLGTALGVLIGSLFALNIDSVMAFVNYLNGGGAWDPSVRGIYALPAELRFVDVFKAVSLSLGLSFVVTIFPARRAARMNPVEALRYE